MAQGVLSTVGRGAAAFVGRAARVGTRWAGLAGSSGERLAKMGAGRRAEVGQGRAVRGDLGGFVTDSSGEASNRPRTQDTGKVSHFARNQPGGVRPSSASPPSPHSPCLTGILTVLLLQIRIRIRAARRSVLKADDIAEQRQSFFFSRGRRGLA